MSHCCGSIRGDGGGAGEPSQFVQSAAIELATTETHASAVASLLDAMTIVMNTGASFLLISMSATFWGLDTDTLAHQEGIFEIRIDTIMVWSRGATSLFDTIAEGTLANVAGETRVAVAAGAHTIQLYWRNTSGGTIEIPIGAGGIGGATLVVKEVLA